MLPCASSARGCGLQGGRRGWVRVGGWVHARQGTAGDGGSGRGRGGGGEGSGRVGGVPRRVATPRWAPHRAQRPARRCRRRTPAPAAARQGCSLPRAPQARAPTQAGGWRAGCLRAARRCAPSPLAVREPSASRPGFKGRGGGPVRAAALVGGWGAAPLAVVPAMQAFQATTAPFALAAPLLAVPCAARCAGWVGASAAPASAYAAAAAAAVRRAAAAAAPHAAAAAAPGEVWGRRGAASSSVRAQQQKLLSTAARRGVTACSRAPARALPVRAGHALHTSRPVQVCRVPRHPTARGPRTCWGAAPWSPPRAAAHATPRRAAAPGPGRRGALPKPACLPPAHCMLAARYGRLASGVVNRWRASPRGQRTAAYGCKPRSWSVTLTDAGISALPGQGDSSDPRSRSFTGERRVCACVCMWPFSNEMFVHPLREGGCNGHPLPLVFGWIAPTRRPERSSAGASVGRPVPTRRGAASPDAERTGACRRARLGGRGAG